MHKDEILIKDVKDFLNQIIIRFRMNDIEVPTKPTPDSKLNNVRVIIESLLKDLDDKENGKYNIRDTAETLGDYYSSTC